RRELRARGNAHPELLRAARGLARRSRRLRAVARDGAPEQAPRDPDRDGTAPSAAPLRDDRRTRSGPACRGVHALDRRAGGGAAQRGRARLRAVRRSGAAVRRRARGAQHLALRGLPQHVPAGVVARHPDARLRRHRIAPRGRAGIRDPVRRGRCRAPPRPPHGRRAPLGGGLATRRGAFPRKPFHRGRARPVRARAARAGGPAMNAVTASLARRALSLGTANAIDYALQFLLPIVLTRTIDPHSFGQYRLLWLAVNTLMLIMPMCMAPSLYYFLPRSDRPTQRVYINQTLIFLAAAGLVSGWAISQWNPLVPHAHALAEVAAGYGAIVPAFAFAWIFASTLDVLPTADERVGWQARAIVAISALLAVTAVKALVLLAYVARYHGIGGPIARASAFKAQFRQAAPFALSGALHGVRTQADQ